MRNVLLILFIAAVYRITVAQQAEQLVFLEKTYDFGSVNENGGNVDHQFSFINHSGRVMRLLSVQPSCGCTTPEWSKEPVQPGETGFIKASFNPKGRPGYFNKSITITTDLDTSPVVIQIKGNVIGEKEPTKTEVLGYSNGNLRTKQSTINIGKVYNNKEPVTQSFQITNTGKEALLINGVNSPAHITLTYPSKLMPGEQSSFTLTYDAHLKNTYGFVADQIEFITTDKEMPEKTYSVFATLEEYFPPLNLKELELAPQLEILPGEIKFGEMLQSETLEREVIIKNNGKKDLLLRALQPNCTCLSTRSTADKLQPGATEKIFITLSAKGRPGLQNKSILVYSNDPRNPVQRIMVMGYVK